MLNMEGSTQVKCFRNFANGRALHLLVQTTVILMSIFGLFAIATAQSPSTCEKEIAQAREKYYAGEFDAAIELLKACLRQGGLVNHQRLQAYQYLAQAYLAKDYFDEAETQIRNMIELEPDYYPDLEQEPPNFVQLVAKVKEKMGEDGQIIAIKAKRLARQLDENLNALIKTPLRIAPGNFTFQDLRVSSPFLYYFQNTLEKELDESPRFQAVKRHELQNQIKRRGIEITARLMPSTLEAIQEFVEADAVLLGKCWDHGDSLSVHVALVESSEKTTLSSAVTQFDKNDLPENMLIVPNNFAEAQEVMAEWREEASPSLKLQIKLWVDRLDGGVYKQGEKMTASVRANKPCYLYLLYRDAGGNTLLLFPNRFRQDNRLAVDTEYKIPDQADQFDFTITPPFGMEILKAFASTQPLPELEGKEVAGGIKQLKLSATELAKTLRGVALTKRPESMASGENQAERAEASCVVTTLEK